MNHRRTKNWVSFAVLVGATTGGCYIETRPNAPTQGPYAGQYAPGPGTPGGVAQPSTAPPPAAPRTTPGGLAGAALGHGHIGMTTPGQAVAVYTVRGAAPRGIDDRYLGIPLNADFVPLVGRGATTLFPQAGPPLVTTVNAYDQERKVLHTQEEVTANVGLRAAVWGVSTGVATSNQTMYAYYRAFETESVHTLNDQTQMAYIPPDAVYYPWRIHYGHFYEETISGSANAFNASVQGDYMIAAGAISTFTQKYQLASQATGLGLRPKDGSAPFFADAGAVASKYTTEGPAVPMFVEYRRLNGRQGRSGQIASVHTMRVEMRLDRVSVEEDGSLGTTPWTMTAACGPIETGHETPPRPFLDARVVDGGVYNTDWTWVSNLIPGSAFTCGASGNYHDRIAQGSLGTGGTGTITVPSSSGSVQGEFRGGGDAHTAYRIHWTARFVQQ